MKCLTAVLGIACAAALGGCGGDDAISVEPYFAEDYQASFTQVRDCRPSGDHNLNNVRILADPLALAPYRDRDQPFPEGAVVLKEEYDFGDISCQGDIVQWDVMMKLPEGAAPDMLDWSWQKVNVNRRVKELDSSRCWGCHADCAPPDGYGGTCSAP